MTPTINTDIPQDVLNRIPKSAVNVDITANPNKDESRLVVVEQVSHHRREDPTPFIFISRYSKFITNKREQTFDREPPDGVGEEWTNLMTLCKGCWLEKASQLVIENKEGTNLTFNMTQQQSEELARRVIEVKFGEQGKPVEIPPSESMRVRPMDLADIYLRSRSKTARVRIGIVPL